jgi:hypothetical protein
MNFAKRLGTQDLKSHRILGRPDEAATSLPRNAKKEGALTPR